jgi:hypothetical protein
MAYYGQANAVYNLSYYDGYVPPIESEIKMSNVKAGVTNKNAAALIQHGRNVHTGLTNNPYVPTPAPTLVALEAGIDALETANDAYEAEKDVLKAKKAERDAALKALGSLLRTEAATVQTATGGDEAQILSTGFEVASTPAPLAQPNQVLDLRVTASDHEGALKASWKKAARAQRYELQASVDPPTPTSWVMKGSSNKTRADVNTFTSGDRIWLRVRAVNAAGDGAWSDPAVKTVP